MLVLGCVATARTSELPRPWVIVLLVAAALMMARFVGWIVLAIWLGGFAGGLHARLSRLLRGHVHLAALITVIVLSLLLVPALALIAVVIVDAISLIRNLFQTTEARGVLVQLVSDGEATASTSVRDLLLSQGDRAWLIAKQVAGATARIVIGLFILFAGIYAVLVNGRRWYAWLEEYAPWGAEATRRFAAAFTETGRGLAIGIIGAGALQALLATGAYLVLGVPQALALGLLTLIFSIVPVVGTAIVWVPVAAGFAITGRTVEAIGLFLFGVTVIGTIDNLVRPYLARRGKLALPTFVVLVSMFGAIELFGAWGILFGPLVVRLAKEALEMRRDEAVPG
jgi:predicted PurR-regulated permease PerM